jgi:excisionase family DNA binding protein
MPELMTAQQVQELLNVDRTTVYRMLKDGRLKGVKVGRNWRFHPQDLERLYGRPLSSEEGTTRAAEDILPLHCMQPVQDVFAEISEIGAVTTNLDGQPLTRISNSCDFCKLILGTEEGRQACVESWRQLACSEDRSAGLSLCHAGLEYAHAPIVVEGNRIASLVVGQFYTRDPDPQEEAARVQSLAARLHIDPDLLRQASQRISVLDERLVAKLAGWLHRVAATFEEISGERAELMGRLGQIAAMSSLEPRP